MSKKVVIGYIHTLDFDLYADGSANADNRSRCFSKGDMEKLRDALIEHYPLPKSEPVQPEPSEYKVREGEYEPYEIYKEVQITETKVFAYSDEEVNAKKIAQALNEAEGL